MAYDVELADRIRELLVSEPGHTEKAMFGGLCFMVADHMALVATGRGGLMLRVDETQRDDLLTRAHTEPVVMRGRETRGWLHVAAAGIGDDDALGRWVETGLAAVHALPR